MSSTRLIVVTFGLGWMSEYVDQRRRPTSTNLLANTTNQVEQAKPWSGRAGLQSNPGQTWPGLSHSF